MGAGGVKGNPQRILSALDERLTAPVELTLYGRAALQLGFDNAPEECSLTRDVDAVLWLGQAEEMLGDMDLLLSKLMRDDPIDLKDAQFIIEQGHLSRKDVEKALIAARIPDVEEIRDQFKAASRRLLNRWPESPIVP